MITPRDKRFYALAMRIAELSDCDDKHGAVYALGSRVVALAPNTSASSRGRGMTQHAEQRAAYRHGRDRREGTIYSARLHTQRISAPCVECQNAMRDASVERCVYHDGKQLQEMFP